MTSRSEFTRINAPRVEKINDMVRVIAKSAKSNSVEKEELAEIVRPALEALSALCPTSAAVPVAAAVEKEDAPVVEPRRLINGLHHLQASELVDNIPDNMLTAVLTRIVSRMSESWETKT